MAPALVQLHGRMQYVGGTEAARKGGAAGELLLLLLQAGYMLLRPRAVSQGIKGLLALPIPLSTKPPPCPASPSSSQPAHPATSFFPPPPPSCAVSWPSRRGRTSWHWRGRGMHLLPAARLWPGGWQVLMHGGGGQGTRCPDGGGRGCAPGGESLLWRQVGVDSGAGTAGGGGLGREGTYRGRVEGWRAWRSATLPRSHCRHCYRCP